MPAIKRRVVKKPRLTPEESETLRLERIQAQEENHRRYNEHEALKRKEAAEKLARYEAEIAADKRPRWMRESVVDPDWIAEYEKANPPLKRPFRLGSDMLGCIGYAGEAASAEVFGNIGKISYLSRVCTDEHERSSISEGRNGTYEVASTVAAIISATLDAADDTIPEDAERGTLPDRTKVEKALRGLLGPALHQFHVAINTIIGRIVANDDKHDIIGDQLQADLWYRAIDEVDYEWSKNGEESV